MKRFFYWGASNMTNNELTMLQALPLDVKILKTKQRIREAIDRFGAEGLYLSFSGGKDSTVVHHILSEVEQEFWGEQRIPRVFVNTGLEFPELIKFATNKSDVLLRPALTHKEVITKYGYPVISKSQSMAIRKLTRQNLSEKYRNKLLYGDERGTMGKLSNKWHYLLDADFDIGEQCCNAMKKRPFHAYEKETGRIPIIGVMADESTVRQLRYLADGGCNAFETNRPQSKPIGFWKEQDVLQYIKMYDIEICSVYGDVIQDDQGTYKTTGLTRTGCVFCMFGCHLQKGPNRFQQLKVSHPRLYKHCIEGGEYTDQGKWIPNNKGLGMGHVLDEIGVSYN